ncbi:flavin prenyltransferase UbiX [Pseudaeromonas sp. ZJS20]|uniref:flavin prenyltransferase UbiX n=1 Tax=Pseudaeromonas aegiceratis TaxID=3153928 RepID=UPI00390CBB02
MRRLTLAITGASGAPYALRLLACLLQAGVQVHLLLSDAARVVLATEVGETWPTEPAACRDYLVQRFGCAPELLQLPGRHDWFSPVASGSAAPKQMVVLPCSMGTLSAIAHGTSDNLIERAADVVIKERGQLILVPRETPYSSLHLENMLKLSRLGVTILPASPGFYHQPAAVQDLVDFVVARLLDHLELPQDLMAPWGQ